MATTKKEMFATIKSLLSDNAEVVEFCDHEIELLNKKSGSAHKPTKTQVENEGFKVAIFATLLEVDQPMTVGEIMENCSAVSGLTSQRVTAIVTQMFRAGKVSRTEVKKKAFFSVPVDGEDGSDE